MSDPSLALQKAFHDALSSIAGGRIYDQPPAEPTFPYLTIADAQVNGDFADCYDGSESFLDVHVWSRGVGSVECKTIGSAVRDALNHADLTLVGHTLELIELQTARYFRDPDGLTSHGVLTFRTLSQPSD